MSLLEPPQRFVALLRESLALEGDGEGGAGSSDNNGNDLLSDGTEDILSYVAFLAAGLCDAEEFTSETWIETLKPYMEQLASNDKVKIENHDEVLNKFREAAEKAIMGQEDDQESYGDHDDEGYEEVCDFRFK